jgi:phytoene/squalene synthetase
VGELILRLWGEWTVQRGAWSDALCTALQLTNFWQDVSVDAKKNRLTIPQEDLQTLGITESAVFQGPATPPLRELIAYQVDRTWGLFREGQPLCDDVPRSLRRELRLVWLGGTQILKKIEKQKWDVWSHRPTLSKTDWVGLLSRTLFWKTLP